MTDFDALVVGGGPAGLASGIVLARLGCRVLLCERRALPADKPCGEGLMPPGVTLLEELGVRRSALRESCRFNGIRYVAPSGRAAEVAFAEGPGLGIRRLALSAALVERARQTPGLVLAECSRVELDSGVRVDGTPIAAKLLIGADGLHSIVRRSMHLHAGVGPLRRWGARRHYALEPWTPNVEVCWSKRGIEAYVTPVGRRLLGVAFLWDRDRVGALPGGIRLFESLLDEFPLLRERLAGAAPASDVAAVGPLFERARSVVGDGVALVGDAGGYVDAITGEGLSLAFAEALALGDTLAPALRGEIPLRRALRAYERRHSRITRGYRLFTRLVLEVGRRPPLVESAIALLAEHPLLFQRLLSANMRVQKREHMLGGLLRSFRTEIVAGA
jgi:flavin-dependent dehydrogenase